MTAPIAPGVVTSLDPFEVKLGADGVAQPCQRVAPAQIGQRGGVLILGGQRVWLGAYDQNDIDVSGLVPWTTPNRHITIGPDGDQQPALELIRDRPTGRHSALMYLALGATPELAWLLRDGDTALATLRLTKDGLRLQNIATGTTRYFAYQDDVAALDSKVNALPATAAGTAGPITLTGTSRTYNVTFPTGRFATPPTVTPNLYSGTQRCRADNVTATGFRLVIWDTATMSGSAYVHWQAIAPH